MKAFCCDRCGAFQKKDALKDWIRLNEFVDMLDLDKGIIELCSVCATAFKAFMKGGKP
jgi:hypothetical protein